MITTNRAFNPIIHLFDESKFRRSSRFKEKLPALKEEDRNRQIPEDLMALKFRKYLI